MSQFILANGWTLNMNEDGSVTMVNPNAPYQMRFDPKDKPYAAPIFVEKVANDGLAGIVAAMVCIVSNQTFVAVKKNVRHGLDADGILVDEAWRKSVREGEPPCVYAKETMVVVDLSNGRKNTARTIGLVHNSVTILHEKELPDLDSGYRWVTLAEYVDDEDDICKQAVLEAYYKGFLK